MAKTLLEKEWDAHVVSSEASRLALLYIDCHLVHQRRSKSATILLARTNFGCGSSREHAPWALLDCGFCSIIAPSFADIFYNNCFKNGMLPIRLPEAQVAKLFQECSAHLGYKLTVDLERQAVEDEHDNRFTFEVDSFKRECLLRGLDDIGLTLEREPDIRDYEARRRVFS